MVKLDKIYTRSGDDGKTSLGDGTRLPKFDLRLAAYGTIDEANSVIGVALLYIEESAIREILAHIQNDLFDVGADLCRPEHQDAKTAPLRVTEKQSGWIEDRIDDLNSRLTPLSSFVLPGGTTASSYLHLARTVTRRAERCIAELAQREPLNPATLIYVNRLSDFLFVAARYMNDRGRKDVTWKPGMNR